MTQIGPQHARCEACELKDTCESAKHAYGVSPTKPFNGIMLVLDAPLRSDVIGNGGERGALLRRACQDAGIELEGCHVTYATLALTKPISDFQKAYPNAVYSCLSRLEEEIAQVRPRVIMPMGARATLALTGHEEVQEKMSTAPPCGHCKSEDRKVTGVQCAVGDCQHVWEGTDLDQKPETCPKCGANWKRLKIRKVKCPVCKGKKRALVQSVNFRGEYKLGEIAAAPIPAARHGWDEYGVRYIVPTYDPSSLLRPPPASGMGGQFAYPPLLAAVKKAVWLTDHDAAWSFTHKITSSDPKKAAQELREFIAPLTDVAVDIETEAWGTAYRCTGCGAKKENAVVFRPYEEMLSKGEFMACEACGDPNILFEAHAVELDARKVPQVSAIKCIGFGTPTHALVVNTTNMEVEDPELTSDELFAALIEVLEDPFVSKTFHHGNYDCPVIEKLWGVKVEGYRNDTLILHHDLFPDERHNLSHVVFNFSDAPIWKPPKQLHGREAHGSFEELAEYNARDVCLTAEVLSRMRYRLKSAKLERVYALDMKLEQQALDMWRNGMPIDLEAAKRIGNEAQQRSSSALEKMREILKWPDFNPASGAQLAEAMFDRLGNVPTKFTPTGARVTDKTAIVALRDCPFKRALLEYKDSTATLRNYFEVRDGVAYPGRSLHVWVDGRIRGIWKAFGTRTGRFSSNPNFQNWPKWLRNLVVAPKGRKIVGADYDQLELRIMAGLANDPVLIDRCLNADDSDKLDPDKDPHSYVASIAFADAFLRLDTSDPQQKSERKALRDLCKRVIYGLNYGAGDKKVLESIYAGGYDGPPLNVSMIGRIRTAIYDAFKGIPEFQKHLQRQAEKDHEVRSPLLGRRRTFPLGDVPFTEILNFPIQSAAADIMNQRATQLWEEVSAHYPTALYIAQVHDAVYYECDEEDAEAIRDLMTNTLSYKTALVEGGTEIPFTAAAEIADCWGDAG